MTLSEAVLTRFSLRAYLPDPIDPDQRRQLEKTIGQCNAASGLHIRLVCDDPAPFAGISRSYGMLTGVRNYLLFAGPASDPDLKEKCGYYGEKVVLTAAAMGLGTCWVGGTYDKSSCLDGLAEGDELVCVAAIGYGPETRTGREKLIRMVTGRKSKSVTELAEGLSGAPDWFMSAIASVQRAPSARNRQPVCFERQPDNTVEAYRVEETAFSPVDLGIAKLHFELGAHGGTWTWGSGGVFTKAKEEKSCGAVIWRGAPGEHQYLLAQHGAGHWSFPKGHVERGENERQTALREIREETGLDVELDTRFREVVTYYPAPGVIKDVVFFLAQPTGGTEHAQEEEIARLGWFTFQEARPLVTFASDEEVLLAAEAYIQRTGTK